MGKFSGVIQPLLDFREPFSLDSKSKIYNLSSSIVIQQSSVYPSKSLADNALFTGGTGSPADFNPGSVGFSFVPKGLLCGTTSTKFALPSYVADSLSFTSPELTVSFWVSGSLHSTKIGDLHEKSVIQSSGSNGVQFMIGNWDTSTTPSSSHFIAAVFDAGTTNESMNVVASTHKTAGKTGPAVWGTNTKMGYHGRYVQVIEPLSSNNNPVNMSKSGWHHVVYVQKAAKNPLSGPSQFLFGKETSPLSNTSKTGEEGLCEMWLDGELVYTTPQYGPFPQGHSPFFYEDGLSGLNGSTDSRFFETVTDSSVPNAVTIKNRTLRQSSAQAFISGSSANGDAIAQLTVWRRVLRKDEITAVYKGTLSGVYKNQSTSFSSAPKRLLNNDVGRTLLTSKNSGFGDSRTSESSPQFSDLSTSVEKIGSSPYQGNFFYQPFGDLTPRSLIDAVVGDGSTLANLQSQVAAFKDSVDKTTPVDDGEFVIPSGSAMIRISIPNTDPNIAAGRSHNSGTVDTFSSQVGLDSTGSMCIGTGFLYYSPKLNRWVEKRADGATSFTSDRRLVSDNSSASNYILQVSSSRITDFDSYGRRSMVKAGGTLSQFSWSPQFGYFFNHVEHLQQVGYSRIGWPTSFFGAPNAPKYHGYDHETIKLSDYIDRPFLLKRIELRIPVKSERRFGFEPSAFNAGDKSHVQQITNKKDIDNYVFFLYRQRRVSRDRDSWLDRGTSKRYLIASASVCYYNSASFGGAFKDGFFNQDSWVAATALSGALAEPNDTVDYFSQSLTKISGSNPVLHNPHYLKEWGSDRFTFTGAPGNYQSQELLAETTTLNLTMYPTVVPDCQVSPSLMPFTASGLTLDANAFGGREGGYPTDGTTITAITGAVYVTSGTWSNPSATSPAPYVSLISHRWFGGSRPAQIAASEAVDPYDTVRVPSNNDNDLKVRGSVDTNIHITTNFVDDVKQEVDNDGFTRYGVRLSRGSIQSQGLSLVPIGNSGSADPTKFTTQMPIDPQSVNSPVPAGGKANVELRGRETNFDNPNDFTTSFGGTYGGYYGWRFISSFQIGDFNEQQQYSPAILDPQDELIIGLDAGTFGPPDLDADSLVGDNEGPTTGTPASGLGPLGSNRLFKNTHMKEYYRKTLSDSRLKILTGDAEIVLIGDFLRNDSSTYVERSTPEGVGITRVIGNDPILDQSNLFNLDLLSGSMFTRIFTGSEGPQGLIDGNTSPESARRFFKDAGTRRDI
jgi:hypothetical protein